MVRQWVSFSRPADVTRMGKGGICFSFLRLFHLLQGLVHPILCPCCWKQISTVTGVVVTTAGLW